MLSQARCSALNILARREHSQLELSKKLLAKGFVAADVNAVIQDLAAKGLQSDSRFVDSYINARKNRGFGPVRIRAELRERGIDSELCDQVLDGANAVWIDLLQQVRCKKFGNNMPKTAHDRAAQMRYLQYKGFTTDQILNIFKDR